MQKFTRSLTREIEIGGERVAVTLDADGLVLRPVGARRPPHTLKWTGVLCAATANAIPGPDQIAAAVEALKKGAATASGAPAPAAEAPAPAAPVALVAPVAPSAEQVTAPRASGLAAVLARIDCWLAKHRAVYHAGLLEGATDVDCDALSSAVGTPLPADLRTLLKWHDGQNADNTASFERSFFLLDTHEIAEVMKDLGTEPRNGWKPGLIPFLDDGLDDFVCLDTTQAGVPVVECWRGQSHAAVTAPSLTAWLEGFAAALEKGEYFEDPERGSFQRKS